MPATDLLSILVADDEPKIVAFIEQGLQEAGFRTRSCHDGEAALRLAATGQFQAVVLDIMMPRRDGLDVLRELRGRGNPVPIILLSARGAVVDRIAGLNTGADDYLAKPFAVDELVARLRAVVRRLAGDAALVVRYGDLELNLGTREVRRDGRAIALTNREFELLAYLARSPDRVHTRSDLCLHVWGYQVEGSTNLIDVCLQRLRRKLDADRSDPLLHTVRGVGYALRVRP